MHTRDLSQGVLDFRCWICTLPHHVKDPLLQGWNKDTLQLASDCQCGPCGFSCGSLAVFRTSCSLHHDFLVLADDMALSGEDVS